MKAPVQRASSLDRSQFLNCGDPNAFGKKLVHHGYELRYIRDSFMITVLRHEKLPIGIRGKETEGPIPNGIIEVKSTEIDFLVGLSIQTTYVNAQRN